MEVPDEILTQIFDLAADEDVIFQYGLPTAMAESAWFKNAFNEWALRSPQEAINMIQRRSYATKKAIMLTCKRWRRLGAEFLYRCLFFDNPSRLHLLCDILESDARDREKFENPSVGLGWWTRRIHLTRFYASPNRGTSMDDMCSALTTVIKHCPNLSIFIVEWLMPGATFGLVADSLFKYTRKALHTVHWKLPAESIPKVIWALDSLPLVLAAHIEFETPTASTELDEAIHLGSTQDLTLTSRTFSQLTLRGRISEFVEQAIGWNLSGLRNVAFDCGYSKFDIPNVVGFLEEFGDQLTVLDLDSVPPFEIPEILELCPQLEMLSFNGDWRLQSPPLLSGGGVIEDGGPDEASSRRRRQSRTMRLSLGSHHTEMSILTHTPHPRIHTIGLHGLLHAFGFDPIGKSTFDPLRSRVTRRSNDLNFAALNRAQFPQLRCVRVLSRPLLINLNKEDGPKQDEGVEGLDRYNRWWDGCVDMGVRLEDATGGELGRLPQDDDNEDNDDDGEYSVGYSSGEDEDEEWEVDVPPVDSDDDPPHVIELRQLIKECQAMAEDRDESPFSQFIGPAPRPSLSMVGPAELRIEEEEEEEELDSD